MSERKDPNTFEAYWLAGNGYAIDSGKVYYIKNESTGALFVLVADCTMSPEPFMLANVIAYDHNLKLPAGVVGVLPPCLAEGGAE